MTALATDATNAHEAYNDGLIAGIDCADMWIDGDGESYAVWSKPDMPGVEATYPTDAMIAGYVKGYKQGFTWRLRVRNVKAPRTAKAA